MTDDETVRLGEVTLGVRESGPSDGFPVLHFHGTPGSRLEMAWADELVTQAGVRLVAIDRPGYGLSTQIPVTLTMVACLAVDLADHLGWQRFATTGWSGGGPFALATAAVAPVRVSAVGVISGAGPFQEIPGMLDALSGGDADGAALLATDRDAAAAAFAGTFTDLIGLRDEAELLAGFTPVLSERDQRVMARPEIAAAMLHDMHAAFCQGAVGGGWDNVAWIGDWDFDLAEVRCPVRLWYGDEDLMAPPLVGTWLAEHLPTAELIMRQGYGHLAAFEHLPEMLAELISASAPA